MSWDTFDGQAYGRSVAYCACTAEMLQAQKDLEAAPAREKAAAVARLTALTGLKPVPPENTPPAAITATRSKR